METLPKYIFLKQKFREIDFAIIFFPVYTSNWKAEWKAQNP